MHVFIAVGVAYLAAIGIAHFALSINGEVLGIAIASAVTAVWLGALGLSFDYLLE